MLMVDVDPAECLYLPTPDGREVRVEAPHDDAGPQSVMITIPNFKETDRVFLFVDGRPMEINFVDVLPMEISGGKRKSHKTRLALALPDDCRVRYSCRIRKPRKPHQGA